MRGHGEGGSHLSAHLASRRQKGCPYLTPGHTCVGFWLLALCCPNPFPRPKAQGLSRVEPPPCQACC